MASETLMGAKALAAKVVTMMLKALGMTRERILGIGHQQQRLAPILWQRGFKKQ